MDIVAIQDAVTVKLLGLLDFVPSAIFAVVIFVVGVLVANLISMLVRKLFVAINFEKLLASHKIDDALGKVSISSIVERIVKYYVILVFLTSAISFLQLNVLVGFLNLIVLYAPAVMGAVLFVVFSALLGEWVKEEMVGLDKKSEVVSSAANVVKALIVFVGMIVGLNTVGFDTSIIESVFQIVISAIAYGLALAFALAFGLGGQDQAKQMLKDVREHFNF